jgi:hypothetical protein
MTVMFSTVLPRRVHRFAAQHRGHEGVELICVGVPVRESLHTFAFA